MLEARPRGTGTRHPAKSVDTARSTQHPKRDELHAVDPVFPFFKPQTTT
ncbi:hypothetical protein RISK_005327 [Rhodopirellula islandica]|uniref:Uncharacterized protein n=1 Tax=Rhodopirellula islandica TaxID=595434 RepID=A0A0J1B703_RHOIS|nr:hypothetical protein RISK_005327 [Rhodopirellula islandica]